MRFILLLYPTIILILQMTHVFTLGDSSDASDIIDCNKTIQHGLNLRNNVHTFNRALQTTDNDLTTPPPSLADNVTPEPTDPPKETYCPPCVCSFQPSSIGMEPFVNNITISDQVCRSISNELKIIANVFVVTFVVIVCTLFGVIIMYRRR